MAHSWFSRIRAPRSRAPLLVVLLMLTLALTAVLAREAHQASVSHHRVAQSVLRDYVEFASWEFSRAARNEMGMAFDEGLTVSQRAIPFGTAATDAGGPLPPEGCGPGCGKRLPVVTVFRIDPATGHIATHGAPLDPAATRVLTDLHPRVRESRGTETPCTMLVRHLNPPNGTPIAIGFTMAGSRMYPDAPQEMYGFVAERVAVAQLFERIMKQRPLLPPTLIRHGDGNAALSVRVLDEADQQLYESPGFEPSAYAAGEKLDRMAGLLSYEMRLRPSAAEALVIGGLPQSRVWWLLGVLALTTGLVVVALVQLRREYELARLRSDFVSGVSHELRTPLAQIRMFSETLLLGRVRNEDEARRSLEIIQQESRRLGHLVDNVLHFSKGQHGTSRLVRESRPLVPLLREVVDAFAPLARARRVTVRFVEDDDVTASVDASALRQIVLNLLDNAVKYGPLGETVTVTVAFDPGTSNARIMVDDEGAGIATTDIARIWAPFARLPQASAAGVAGAGIGLAVVRELTQLHGGHVSVMASPSGGARFCVELPGATVDETVEDTTAAAVADADALGGVRSLSA